MRRSVTFLAAAALTMPLLAQQPQPPMEAQRRPVFRGGTHFVRVDAYPVKDGRIVENLRAEDFEIFEDGTPQAIESFDFVKFGTFTPAVERRDPSSQREGFDLAADPRYRVFVIVVNVNSSGIRYIQQPLIQFLDRVLGRNDLFGLLTTHNSAKDLVLGQKTEAAQEQIADFWRSSLIDRQPADALDACGPGGLAVKGLFILDETYVALESLVAQLGSLRQERKNIIFVSNGLGHPAPARAVRESFPPRIPTIGVVNGRVGVGDHAGPEANERYCASEIQRLAMIDFDARFRELLKEAKRQNVSFYAITPGGLQAPMGNAINSNNDSLLTLSNETDGVAIVNTNDLTGGMRRIADDLAAYYVLGYYTTNTRWDGGIRRIKVRYKPTGKDIRARREYRAPTMEEIASLSAPPPAPRPAAAAVAAPAIRLVGNASLFRNNAPASSLVCTRADRIRAEWPVQSAIDGSRGRLLDRRGQPLPFPIDVKTDDSRDPRRLVVDLRLTPLARGDYSIELVATRGETSDRQLVAFRVE